jgi:hypothetical protein
MPDIRMPRHAETIRLGATIFNCCRLFIQTATLAQGERQMLRFR